MKKFEGILFCTDLDGTLFASDKTVSAQNLEAIEYFKAEGGLFTFITGRAPKTTEPLRRIVKPNAPYGCLNGGGIYDHQAGKYLWKLYLPEEARLLVKCVDEQLPDLGIQVNTEKEIYFAKDNAAMKYFRAVTGVPLIPCQYDDVQEPILKIVFAHDEEEKIAALIRLLQDHPDAKSCSFIRSERRLFEILPKNASKGTALSKLIELLAVDANKTIAVGDYNNDVSMLQSAAVGVAVENAVDEVKAVADYITVSNNDHAIAAIIEQLDRGSIQL